MAFAIALVQEDVELLYEKVPVTDTCHFTSPEEFTYFVVFVPVLVDAALVSDFSSVIVVTY